MLRTEPTLIEAYVRTGLVKLQFWHITDFGDASVQASTAAECAGEQGAFWRMHNALFENQNQLWDGKLEPLLGLAQGLSLDIGAFRQCMAGDAARQRVIDINNKVKTKGIRVRPTFEINGQRVEGSPPIDQWRSLLDSLATP